MGHRGGAAGQPEGIGWSPEDAQPSSRPLRGGLTVADRHQGHPCRRPKAIASGHSVPTRSPVSQRARERAVLVLPPPDTSVREVQGGRPCPPAPHRERLSALAGSSHRCWPDAPAAAALLHRPLPPPAEPRGQPPQGRATPRTELRGHEAVTGLATDRARRWGAWHCPTEVPRGGPPGKCPAHGRAGRRHRRCRLARAPAGPAGHLPARAPPGPPAGLWEPGRGGGSLGARRPPRRGRRPAQGSAPGPPEGASSRAVRAARGAARNASPGNRARSPRSPAPRGRRSEAGG